MGRSNFRIQFTPELIEQLVGDGEEVRKPKKVELQAPPFVGVFPAPLPQSVLRPPPSAVQRTEQEPEADEVAPAEVPERDEIKQEPESVSDVEERPKGPEPVEKPVEVARDLKPLMRVLEKSEQYGQELQRKGLEELDVMKKRAEELQQKHLSKPVQRKSPCLAEQEECIKCYKSKDPIRCQLEADAYVKCAAAAFKSTVS